MTIYEMKPAGLSIPLFTDLHHHLFPADDPARHPRAEIVFPSGATVGLEVLWSNLEGTVEASKRTGKGIAEWSLLCRWSLRTDRR